MRLHYSQLNAASGIKNTTRLAIGAAVRQTSRASYIAFQLSKWAKLPAFGGTFDHETVLP